MRAPFAHIWRVVDGQLAPNDMHTDTLLIHRAVEQQHSGGGHRADQLI